MGHACLMACLGKPLSDCHANICGGQGEGCCLCGGRVSVAAGLVCRS